MGNGPARLGGRLMWIALAALSAMLIKAFRARRRVPADSPGGETVGTATSPRGGEGSRAEDIGYAGHGRYVVPVLLLCALGVALAQAVVVPALPLFQRQLELTPAAAAWLLTAFMLASAVATPIAGRLGDLIGYRRVMVVCLLCLAAGTLALRPDAGHGSARSRARTSPTSRTCLFFTTDAAA
ncbi:MFS transporter, partial [Streptomyces sp. Agncl-13]|uniref:MFS transporter n=1 Tax=Streptomyces sp. Agncl-13 TaxID=3400628 RepID=UPI003A8BF4DD